MINPVLKGAHFLQSLIIIFDYLFTTEEWFSPHGNFPYLLRPTVIFRKLAIFTQPLGWSFFQTISNYGLAATATTVSLHMAAETRSRYKQSRGGAQLVLWNTSWAMNEVTKKPD